MQSSRIATLVPLLAVVLAPGCITTSPYPDRPGLTLELPSAPPGSPESAKPTPAPAPARGEAGSSEDRVQELLKPSSSKATIDNACQNHCDEQARLCYQYQAGAIADCQPAARQCRESCVR